MSHGKDHNRHPVTISSAHIVQRVRFRMKFLTSFLILLSSCQAAVNSCPTIPFEDKCPEGCYFEDNSFNQDGTRPCTPVGLGQYSPARDNHRYPCNLGTFSDSETAGKCRDCPTGTHSATTGSAECETCPSASFTNMPMSVFCSPCDPEHYSGDGANSIQVWDGKVFCSFHGTSDTSPTSVVTHAPQETDENTKTAVGESMTTDQDIEDTVERQVCFPTEYEWHGSCTKCPSIVRTTLQPLWMGLVIIAMVTMLSVLPETSVIWIGLEYLQLVYFLGLVWEIHPFQAHIHRWIISLFAMDIDAGFSWQCLLDLPPDVDRFFIVSLPFVVTAFIGLLSRKAPISHSRRWIIACFHVGHFKLVLTAVEALHCDGGDWFCHDSVLSSVVGVVGIIIYGLVGPIWILRQRYNESKEGDEPKCTHDLGFRNCWWWPGYWMLRRSILAILPSALSDGPSWVLIILLVLLMATELLQRVAFQSPKEEDNESSEWFRESTVDVVLQASLICLTGLVFLSLALSPETMRADGLTIAIMFFVIWMFTTGYWMMALVSEYLKVRLHASYLQEVGSRAEDEKSYTSTSTTSSQFMSPANARSALQFPPSSPSVASENVFHHSLPCAQLPDFRDELEVERLDDEDSFSGWIRDTENVNDKESQHRSYFLSSLYSESSVPPMSFDFDDASTLTDTNSYVRPKTAPRRFEMLAMYKYEPDTASTLNASILESSEDGTPVIFADDEDSPLEYHMVRRRHQRPEDVGTDENMSEVWIDEDTGHPVQHKETGNWADASTGLPVQP